MLRHGPLGHSRPEQPPASTGNNVSNEDITESHTHAPPPPAGTDAEEYFPAPPPPESQPRTNHTMAATPSPRSLTPAFLDVKDMQAALPDALSEEDSSFQNDDTLDDEETFVYEKYQLRELSSPVTEAILSHRDLRKLSLKGNQLSMLPPALSNLSSLYYLNLSHNNFQVVPEVVCELRNLEILDLSHNSLTYLPQSLMNLTQLMGLSLVSNDIEVLPPVIADLDKLEILELEDNPIRIPHVLPEVNSSDEETWLIQIKKLIQRFKPMLENTLANDINKDSRRSIPERSRSASESGVSLRAAKRMGFVMSRHATDQLYVANLHARGMSHDVHMLDSISSAPSGMSSSGATSGGIPTGPSSAGPSYSEPTYSTSSSLGVNSTGGSMTSLSSSTVQSQPQQFPAKPVTGGSSHGLTIATPTTSVYTPDTVDLPTPRSPISVSPTLSPKASPRTNYDPPDAQASSSIGPSGSGRLGTLAEEHDVETYASNGDSLNEADTRPSQMSTPLTPTFPHPYGTAAAPANTTPAGTAFAGAASAGPGPATTSSPSSAGRTASQPSVAEPSSEAGMYGTARRANSVMPPLRETSPHTRGSVATVTASDHSITSPTPANPASLFRESSLRQMVSRSESPRPPDSQRTAASGANVSRSGTLGPAASLPQAAPSTPSGAVHSNSAPGIGFTNSPAVEIPVENISFALKEFGATLSQLAFTFPSHITSSFLAAQAAIASEQWVDALLSYNDLLEKLTVPTTFSGIASQLSRRQQRQLASAVVLTFPELEAAWRKIQQSSVMPLSVSSTQPQAQDDQLHSQLDVATKRAQSVLSLLNTVVAKSAAVAASAYSTTPGSNSTLASTMVSRVRDLSAVCLRCNNSIRSIRALLDQQPSMHTRIRQLGERRRFWDEVNGFLKAVVATLAAVKSALPDMPLLANNRVSTDVADLTRIVKEIPPLLEQSSYRLLLESGGHHSVTTDTEDMYIHPAVMQQAAYQTSTNTPTASTPGGSGQLQAQMMLNSQSQISLPPPTPLTASLGAAAQALISPSERSERPSEGYIQYGLRYKTDMNQ